MAKLDSLWSDGVFLGYRSVSGEIVVGTESGVFKTRTVQRKAYEHCWYKVNMDMVGGVPWKTSTSVDSEEGMMPAVDIVPRAPKEDKVPVSRRLYIRAKDIERKGVTLNWKDCIATLRGEGGVPHSDTCRKRLTEEIEKSDEGRKGQALSVERELEFYERAVMESDHQAKRKSLTTEEEDLTKRMRISEGSMTIPSRRSSSSSHPVGVRSRVAGGEQRGEKLLRKIHQQTAVRKNK